MAVTVRKNEAASRYEIVDEGTVIGIADYIERDDVIVFPHTEVTLARRGNGIGERLVRGALDDVRHDGRRIVPACWFVAQFIDEHAEYRDLVA